MSNSVTLTQGILAARHAPGPGILGPILGVVGGAAKRLSHDAIASHDAASLMRVARE